MTQYYVDFYDSFDGWGIFGFNTDRLFNTLDEAKAKADELQKTLDKGNVDMGEHYGVFSSDKCGEIYCLQGRFTKDEKK